MTRILLLLLLAVMLVGCSPGLKYDLSYGDCMLAVEMANEITNPNHVFGETEDVEKDIEVLRYSLTCMYEYPLLVNDG